MLTCAVAANEMGYLYDEIVPRTSLQIQGNLSVFRHTIDLNSTSSAHDQLTLPVPLFENEIETSQNEAYGHSIGQAGQGQANENEVNSAISEYSSSQLERDIDLPQTPSHSNGSPVQIDLNESSYEEVIPSTVFDIEIVTSQNEAYEQINCTSGQGEAIEGGGEDSENMEGLASSLLGREKSASHCEEVTPPITPQRQEEIETLENKAYNCFDANIVSKTQASHDQEAFDSNEA